MKRSAKKNLSRRPKDQKNNVRKPFNKWFVLVPALLLVIAFVATAVVFFIPRDNTSFSYECYRLKSAVSDFLDDLMDEDYASAARSVSFYSAENKAPLESTEALRSIWAKRMKALRDGVRNIYLSDYNDLSVRKENGVFTVTVLLNVQLQGQADTFSKDPYTLTVAETEDGWKISDITEQTVLTDFEKAISGAIFAAETEGGAL